MADLPDGKFPPQATQPGIVKEKEIGKAETLKAPEKVLVVERREPEIPPELVIDGYLERVEKDAELKTPVTDDQGQVLVTSPAAQQVEIVLPMTQESYLNPKNWHRPVVDAIRWLLEWTKRIIKMKSGETVFRESN